MSRWIGLAIAVCLSSPLVARAGVCLDDEEIEGYVKELERFAKGGEEPQGYWSCAGHKSSFGPRVAKACAKVVEASAAKGPRSYASSACVQWLVGGGTTRVGSVDLVALLLEGTWELYTEVSDRLQALAASGDPRARAFVAGKLREHLAAVGAKRLRGWKANAWVKWQVGGLAVLGKLGDASDVALIDELVAASKDKKVRKAATKAKAAIDARAPSP